VSELDAVVVGAGPNGLAAAVILARAGLRVTLFERESTIGGGARTAELTLPGYLHDVCSAVHPMALASPFFREFGLEQRIDLRVPEISYAHPLDGVSAGIAYRDIGRTAERLGADGRAWTRLFARLSENAIGVGQLTSSTLLRMPRSPLLMAQLGARALTNGLGLRDPFSGEAAPAMLTGVIAHANRRLPDVAAAAAGLVLATHAHAAGWPVPIGGSQSIVDAMARDFIAFGGRIVTDAPIERLTDLPRAKAVLLDVTPRALVAMAGGRIQGAYGRRLARFRYGNAVAKVDFALDGPVPWSDPDVAEAATLHLGGTRAEIVGAENTVARGRMPQSPYVLVSQPSVVDPTRAPTGRHVVWAYTHVPAGSTDDRSEAITAQIERFAPGFRDRILASSSRSAVEIESHNANYVGGDIASGDVSLGQLVSRPRAVDPWHTPLAGVYLCSSSTAPGPGVHGLGGWNAARRALSREFGITSLPSLRP
jgi:phytoene dehydrogenase-like protein